MARKFNSFFLTPKEKKQVSELLKLRKQHKEIRANLLLELEKNEHDIEVYDNKLTKFSNKAQAREKGEIKWPV